MNRIVTKLIAAFLCVVVLTTTVSACGFGHSESLMETSRSEERPVRQDGLPAQ